MAASGVQSAVVEMANVKFWSHQALAGRLLARAQVLRSHPRPTARTVVLVLVRQDNATLLRAKFAVAQGEPSAPQASAGA